MPTLNRERRVNPIRSDPSRTATLRKEFERAMSRRMKELIRSIMAVIGDEDAFGLLVPHRLGLNTEVLTVNNRWKALRQPQQLEAFRLWIAGQVNAGILQGMTETGGAPADLWMEQYIRQAYEKGAGRAFDQAAGKHAKDNAATMQYYQGTKDEFLRSAFRRPASVERVKQMATRVWTDLKGVTDTMSTQMQRTLTDSFIQGDGPYVMARKLRTNVNKIGVARSKMIARTETVRAHAEGQLDTLEALGVEEVGVAVEWSTTGDDRVCPICLPMGGTVLKLKEARGSIPAHPNCRCAYIPANVGEARVGQRKSKSAIDKSVRAAKKAGGTMPVTEKLITRTRPKPVVKERASSRAKRAAANVVKASNAGPTFASMVVEETGASSGVAKMAMAAATVGDFAVPGVPVGSMVVTGLATVKSPTASVRVAKRIIDRLMGKPLTKAAKRKVQKSVVKTALKKKKRTVVKKKAKLATSKKAPKKKSTAPKKVRPPKKTKKVVGVDVKARNAAQDYTTDAFQKVNKGLRSGKITDNRIVQGTDKYLKSQPKFDRPTIRSFNTTENEKQAIIDMLKTGKYTDKAYMSSRKVPTLTDEIALSDGITSKGRVVMRVQGKTGIDISDLSLNPGEGEVLFPRGSSFKVKTWKETDNGGLIIDLVE